MSAVRAGRFGATQAETSTNVSQSFQFDTTTPDKRFALLCVATVDTFLHRTEGSPGSAEAATNSNSLYVPALTPILVEGVAGEWLSWIRVGSSSGNVYFTAVDGR